MPAGEIRRRVSRGQETVRPEIRPGIGAGWTEPLFKWLMDTAAETKDIQLDIRDALEKEVELLTVISEQLESRSAGADSAAEAGVESGVTESPGPAPGPNPAVKPAEDPDG